MSETSYTALQGKVCVVTLRGTAGTNYRWCLTSLLDFYSSYQDFV